MTGTNIVHVDMDAFFASVELNRHPELRGTPLIVGGEGQRGVVAAASYEARVYGIHSAMSSVQARRLCPSAVFLPGDHAHYGEVSGRVMEIFRGFTPLVEPLSLDEAFLDVSGSRRLHGDAVRIAHAIRRAVVDQENLTCSVGIAANKFMAKLATESAKPTPGAAGPVPGLGVRVVPPDRVQHFLDPLPIRAIWGIGPATEKRLDRLGVATVVELRRTPLGTLVSALGQAQGQRLHDLSHGRDDRAVTPNLGIKSVSHEETFATDVFESDRLRTELLRMANAVGQRLRASGRRGRTVNIKVRFGDFTTITRATTLSSPTNSSAVIAREGREMLAKVDPTPGVRLLGVGVSGIAKTTAGEQLSFEDLVGDNLDRREAEAAVDSIRDKFGDDAIGPASTLRAGGLAPKRRGGQQWGPNKDG